MTEVMRSEVNPGMTEVMRSEVKPGMTEVMRSKLETKSLCWRKRPLFTQHDRSRAKKTYLKSDNELPNRVFLFCFARHVVALRIYT